MIRRALSFAMLALLVSLLFNHQPGAARAESYTYPSTRPDLFYNFYVGPSPVVGGVPARMYISPRPTPPLVGHTYITYQPLMPHEFLYKHHRRYWRYHPGSGMTRTCVVWW